MIAPTSAAALPNPANIAVTDEGLAPRKSIESNEGTERQSKQQCQHSCTQADQNG